MAKRWFGLFAALGLAVGLTPMSLEPARAGGLCSDIALTCENGRTYPLCPIAISDEGEIVTAQLVLGRGRGLHVRLMPLGIGYRYAGRGVWFDGVRQNATLNFGMNNSVQCTVVKP